MSRLARSTLTVTVLTGAGLLLGFWSQLLIAAHFGVGRGMDAYLAATTLPNLLSTILTTSLAAAFLPVYAEYREKDPREAWKAAGALIGLLGALCIPACAAGMLFSGPIVRVLAPGLDPAAAAQAASLQRWLLPVVLLAAVNQVLSGAHYAEGRFLLPMLIRVSGPLCSLLAVLLLAETLDVRSLVLATLGANALQTAILAAGLPRGARLLPAGPRAWAHPAVRSTFKMAAPLLAAMCLYKLGPAYERWLASGLGTGAISVLGYATRLTQAVQPVLVSGVAISGFALMARLVPREDTAGLRSALERSCGALFFASIPAALLLWGFAEPVIGLAFERGAFTQRDTEQTARLFALYALALPAGAVGTVVGQAFYAYRNVRVPILAGLFDIGLFAGLGALLVPRLGIAGLPLAYLGSFHATVLLVTWRLGRTAGFPVFPLLLRPLWQGLAAGLIALAAGRVLDGLFGGTYAASVSCLGLAALLYLLLQHVLFRSRETTRLLRALRIRTSP